MQSASTGRCFSLQSSALFTSFASILIRLFLAVSPYLKTNDVFSGRVLDYWLSAVTVLYACHSPSWDILPSCRTALRKCTALRTTGIYRLSRNHMLLGLYFIARRSALYVQCPINWILVIIALVVHHKIILAEEVFLQSRSEQEWIVIGRMFAIPLNPGIEQPPGSTKISA